MRGSLKYWLLLLACVAFASVLSYFGHFSYWYAPRLFHSVPMVRQCEAAGRIVLIPVRIIFFCLGGIVDQSTPYDAPMNYVMINGVLLGCLFYACLRPVVFRVEKPGE